MSETTTTVEPVTMVTADRDQEHPEGGTLEAVRSEAGGGDVRYERYVSPEERRAYIRAMNRGVWVSLKGDFKGMTVRLRTNKSPAYVMEVDSIENDVAEDFSIEKGEDGAFDWSSEPTALIERKRRAALAAVRGYRGKPLRLGGETYPEVEGEDAARVLEKVFVPPIRPGGFSEYEGDLDFIDELIVAMGRVRKMPREAVFEAGKG